MSSPQETLIYDADRERTPHIVASGLLVYKGMDIAYEVDANLDKNLLVTWHGDTVAVTADAPVNTAFDKEGNRLYTQSELICRYVEGLPVRAVYVEEEQTTFL